MKRSVWLWLALPMVLGLIASGCVVETDSCVDDDLDTVCDDEDLNLCVDDITLEYLCDEGCTSADNFCSDPWYINYCAESVWYNTDCQDRCTTDQATWGQACAAPALAGECSDADGACLCWCEDAFDSCVAGTEAVRYTRDGATYEIDCKDYCNGTCDDTLGACACP